MCLIPTQGNELTLLAKSGERSVLTLGPLCLYSAICGKQRDGQKKRSRVTSKIVTDNDCTTYIGYREPTRASECRPYILYGINID